MTHDIKGYNSKIIDQNVIIKLKHIHHIDPEHVPNQPNLKELIEPHDSVNWMITNTSQSLIEFRPTN